MNLVRTWAKESDCNFVWNSSSVVTGQCCQETSKPGRSQGKTGEPSCLAATNNEPSALYKEHHDGSVGAGYGEWTKIKQTKQKLNINFSLCLSLFVSLSLSVTHTHTHTMHTSNRRGLT